MTEVSRRFPIGAELLPDGTHFRVWAPARKKVEVILLSEGVGPRILASADLAAESDGYFSGFCKEAVEGSLYRFRLDDGDSYPDPASRFQPEGPHGPSQVVHPGFDWTDKEWHGVEREGHVMYEIHIGTFTKEGTWRAATEQLQFLKDLGITLVEVMPVADFPGRFGWGYDGVNHFAPCRLYGEPDDFRRFVNTAHSMGLGVMLDVVYNHFGPEGNYLEQYSNSYYSPHEAEWGRAVNFDGEGCDGVRELCIINAAYWIEEFHLDGLRFDSTQSIHDSSDPHILGEITDRARATAGNRKILLVAENEPQDVRCLRLSREGGYGMDGVWNDDFHHSAYVALTGYHDAYYTEYFGSPQELISAVKWGYLYQGQLYVWQGKRRGTPTFGVSPSCFVNYLQNHDQVGNSAWGTRIDKLTSPGALRAMTALLLLSPQTPMLFQGQEFCSSRPFLYFADLSPEISKEVHTGRIEFLKQFTNVDSPEVIDAIDKPYDMDTFQMSQLDLSERDGKQSHSKSLALHRDLIKLRRTDPVFSRAHACHIEGAVLGASAFLLRYFLDKEQRLLLFNLGRELHLTPEPEPLLAPPENCTWNVIWTSDWLEYGGQGAPEIDTEKFWRVPGNAGVVLAPYMEGEEK